MKFHPVQNMKGEIPTTSMADLAFLLIVFFMLTSTFTSRKGLDYTLTNGDEDPNSPIIIEITKNGNALLEGHLFGPNEMTSFSETIKYLGQSRTNRLAILLAADDCAYGDTIRIMDILKQHAFEFAIPIGNERAFFQ